MSVLPFGHSGAEAVPGQAGYGCPSSCQKQGSAPSLGKPRPSSAQLGPGLSSGFLETPRKRLNQNQLFSSLSYSPPLSSLSFFGHLLLDVSEMGFQRAARAAPSQYCSPSFLSGPSASPLPCLHQVFPPDSKNQLSTSLPSAASVLSSVRPARGADPLSHQEGFGPS